jgi:REP element-mobilizing transposase RayT
MPPRLERRQQTGDLHFITFSCHGRQPYLSTPHTASVFEHSLESTRLKYQFNLFGYVVMPEHVHLLLSEPPPIRSPPSSAPSNAPSPSNFRKALSGSPATTISTSFPPRSTSKNSATSTATQSPAASSLLPQPTPGPASKPTPPAPKAPSKSPSPHQSTWVPHDHLRTSVRSYRGVTHFLAPR